VPVNCKRQVTNVSAEQKNRRELIGEEKGRSYGWEVIKPTSTEIAAAGVTVRQTLREDSGALEAKNACCQFGALLLSSCSVSELLRLLC
jgi:hypothetical protein